MRKAQNAVALDNTADKFTETTMNTPVAETSVTVANTNTEAVKSAPFSFTDSEVKEADKHCKKVISELGKAEKSFTQVALEVYWLYKDNRYKALETASTFAQFVKNRFGFKKTQAYALVNIVDRFGEADEQGNYRIKADYVGYGQSKLLYITSLSDEQIKENIKPDMSVAEIRKTVKGLQSDDSAKSESKESKGKKSKKQDNVVDGVLKSEKFSQPIVSYGDFKTFEDDSANFFALVNKVFQNAENYKNLRVVISYEHD